MADRYFVDKAISPGAVVLNGPEAHHLIHVMRAAVGMHVVLFDGSGAEYPSTVESVGRSEVRLCTLSREEVDRELPFDLTVGVALPKGDRQKWLVEKATELGVTRIVPLETERAVAQPVDQAIARLRRQVIEASKQCGRNRLMEIVPAQRWADFLRGGDNDCRVFAHPGAPFARFPILDAGTDVESSPRSGALARRGVRVAVGPEGGFTDDEAAMAEAAGWVAVGLGDRILRIETAALSLAAMAAAAWQARWGCQRY